MIEYGDRTELKLNLAEKDRQLEEAKALLKKALIDIPQAIHILSLGVKAENSLCVSAAMDLTDDIRAYLSEEKEADEFCEWKYISGSRNSYFSGCKSVFELPNNINPNALAKCKVCGKPLRLIEDGKSEEETCGMKSDEDVGAEFEYWAHEGLPAGKKAEPERCPTCESEDKNLRYAIEEVYPGNVRQGKYKDCDNPWHDSKDGEA